LILALYEHRDGVETGPGTHAVYDVEQGSAHFGAASVGRRALVWELDESPGGEEALLAADVALDGSTEWLMRCDRVDFPPADEETAFVRVMLLPRVWAGKRTIRYVDPADEEKPKLQRATLFFDEPIEL
jgi:hypothetical protein